MTHFGVVPTLVIDIVKLGQVKLEAGGVGAEAPPDLRRSGDQLLARTEDPLEPDKEAVDVRSFRVDRQARDLLEVIRALIQVEDDPLLPVRKDSRVALAKFVSAITDISR